MEEPVHRTVAAGGQNVGRERRCRAGRCWAGRCGIVAGLGRLSTLRIIAAVNHHRTVSIPDASTAVVLRTRYRAEGKIDSVAYGLT
ncbi:hypothetical protein Vau01_037900 [Virgisporangium aurantiacum]|uniref:Uncharacterized protein n=1 Tax=Virgisporangium aurantiacum TaxID=175570 RepID=A0A8J4DZT4_9ACTN|nr:hypothetical protein Vau01_037900 [Virgisporangium aurantiacum]